MNMRDLILARRLGGGGGGSYEQGFADGKASVKHIIFSVYVDWEYIDYCAFEGMTWREWVEQKFSSVFIIDGSKVKYDNGWQEYIVAGVSADDIIVANGYYETMPPPEEWWLHYNDEIISLFRNPECGAEDFVNSEYNTLGFSIDDSGYLRTPTGEFVYRSIMGDEKRYVEAEYPAISVHSAGEFYYCNDFIPEQWADGEILIYIVEQDRDVCFKFVSGMTWQEFAVSNFSDSIYITGDAVGHSCQYFDALYLNGVKVKPTDVIVSGIEYEGRSE
jgi:hypothetical protein